MIARQDDKLYDVSDIRVRDQIGHLREVDRIYARHGDKLYLVWQRLREQFGFIQTADGFFIQTADGFFIKCSDQ